MFTNSRMDEFWYIHRVVYSMGYSNERTWGSMGGKTSQTQKLACTLFDSVHVIFKTRQHWFTVIICSDWWDRGELEIVHTLIWSYEHSHMLYRQSMSFTLKICTFYLNNKKDTDEASSNFYLSGEGAVADLWMKKNTGIHPSPKSGVGGIWIHFLRWGCSPKLRN